MQLLDYTLRIQYSFLNDIAYDPLDVQSRICYFRQEPCSHPTQNMDYHNPTKTNVREHLTNYMTRKTPPFHCDTYKRLRDQSKPFETRGQGYMTRKEGTHQQDNNAANGNPHRVANFIQICYTGGRMVKLVLSPSGRGPNPYASVVTALRVSSSNNMFSVPMEVCLIYVRGNR